MAMQTSAFCDNCQEKRLFQKESINHPLHIILTLITGFWGIVYGFLLVSRKYRCQQCGTVLKDG